MEYRLDLRGDAEEMGRRHHRVASVVIKSS